jgi:hypothetical protein
MTDNKANQTNNTVPAFVRSFATIIILTLCIILVLGISACSASSFDPTAKAQRISAGNSVQMTLDEYYKTSPVIYQNKTLTTVLPIFFKDNRVPTLHIERVDEILHYKQKGMYNILGLEQGDVIFSPYDGQVGIFSDDKAYLGLLGVDLEFIDASGNKLLLSFSTTGLDASTYIRDNIDQATEDGGLLWIPIKKGDPIGSLRTSDKHNMFNGQIQINGVGPYFENYFFAVTPEGKLIEIKK